MTTLELSRSNTAVNANKTKTFIQTVPAFDESVRSRKSNLQLNLKVIEKFNEANSIDDSNLR
jgi:hypothetical protein